MNITRAKDIALNHVPTEIFVGHNAISLYIAISEHAARLNASPFRRALGLVQRHALDSFVLSICKLYEKSCSKYPNFSIRTALRLLIDNTAILAVISPNYVKLESFIQSDIDPSFAVASKADIDRIPDLLLGFFSDRCPRTPPRLNHDLDAVLDALKVLRDKRVAHYEATDISGLGQTDVNGALRLLAFATSFVNLIGYGFFGVSKEGAACADDLSPQKSIAWSEMIQIIKILEQDGSGKRLALPDSSR